MVHGLLLDMHWLGRVLKDTYEVMQLLGSGGMGAVYKGRHLRTGGLVAIKVLRPEARLDGEVYRRFMDEARIISRLRHPHIVQVLDFDEDTGSPFLVLEFLDGEDLEQRLSRCGRLSLGEVRELAWQIGGALQAAHEQGVTHRDIKPQNIFLAQYQMLGSTAERVKIVDFGVAKIRHTISSRTQDAMLLGTPRYMAPEAVAGAHSRLDGRADQWSLAVMIYQMLTGRVPFDAETLAGLAYQITWQEPTPLATLVELPSEFAAAVARALAKRPEDRFASMREFIHALYGEDASRATGGTLVLVPTEQVRERPARGWSHAVLTLMVGAVLAGDSGVPLPRRAAPASIAATSSPTPAQPPLSMETPRRVAPLREVVSPPPPEGPVSGQRDRRGPAAHSSGVRVRPRQAPRLDFRLDDEDLRVIRARAGSP